MCTKCAFMNYINEMTDRTVPCAQSYRVVWHPCKQVNLTLLSEKDNSWLVTFYLALLCREWSDGLIWKATEANSVVICEALDLLGYCLSSPKMRDIEKFKNQNLSILKSISLNGHTCKDSACDLPLILRGPRGNRCRLAHQQGLHRILQLLRDWDWQWGPQVVEIAGPASLRPRKCEGQSASSCHNENSWNQDSQLENHTA